MRQIAALSLVAITVLGLACLMGCSGTKPADPGSTPKIFIRTADETGSEDTPEHFVKICQVKTALLLRDESLQDAFYVLVTSRTESSFVVRYCMEEQRCTLELSAYQLANRLMEARLAPKPGESWGPSYTYAVKNVFAYDPGSGRPTKPSTK